MRTAAKPFFSLSKFSNEKNQQQKKLESPRSKPTTHIYSLILPPPLKNTQSTARQFLQPGQPPVENIAIPPIRILRILLPNRLIPPPPRHRPRSRSTIPRQHERARAAKSRTIPRTRHPPAIGSINQRPAARAALVRVDEIADPGHHAGLREPVAGLARGGRVVFHVEHAGQGDAVGGPAAAVREEEGRLRGP